MIRARFGVLFVFLCLTSTRVHGQDAVFSFAPRPVGASGGKFDIWLRAPEGDRQRGFSFRFDFDDARITRILCDPVATGAASSIRAGNTVSLFVPLPPGALADNTYVAAQCSVWFLDAEAAGTTFNLTCDRDALEPGVDCEDGQLVVRDDAPVVCDGDSNRDTAVHVTELVRAVNRALGGCPASSIFAP